MREVVDPKAVQRAERAMAPLWVTSIVAPEVAEEFDSLGLEGTERYFAPRAAPLGAASRELVIATFFNFSPRAVGHAIPGAWDKAPPMQILDAQRTGIDRALRRAFASIDTAIIDEALTLLRTAAEDATACPEGRPLFAAYASLEWPEEPHVALWHSHYLLREFRGDGHIALLLSEGLTGITAFVLNVALHPTLDAIKKSRAWNDDEWATAVESLRSTGWLDAGGTLALSEEGARRREAIEQQTNFLNRPAYQTIGQGGCDRLIELGDPIGHALTQAGLAFTI